jgi:long-chain acyl-CoA synthetase
MDRAQALALLTAPGAPFELQPVEVYGRSCRGFRDVPATLRELYFEARSELPFIVYADERLTFETAWQNAASIGALLVNEYGLAKGDRVAISMRNYPEWITAFMAATSVGCIAVAMNSLWTPDEMQYGLQDCGARVLFADQERLHRLAQCADLPAGLRVLAVRSQDLCGTGAVHLGEALAGVQGSAMPLVEMHPNDDATILYTSGSTGHPKGAVSCHRNLVTALRSWELDAQASLLMEGIEPPVPEQQPATLLGVPLFHATGSHAVLLTSYRGQRRVVCMYKWDVEQAAELIERERINSFVAPPAMTGDLVELARTTRRDLSCLERLGGGGAPRAPEQVRNIDAVLPRAAPGTGWGMTETNAIGVGINGQEYLERPASSGRCSAVLDLRIVDESGEELPVGERGELQVRGTTIFRGYWNRPEATEETFDGDWLKTGDVAYLDADGYLYIVDRIKDLVIRGGENIGCGAVEAALLEHPGVLEASVYAIPDERLGEEVGAIVYVTEPLDADALRGFLRDRLARFEIPRYLDISVTPLPRTGSGKIFKRQLREEAVARHAE